MIEFAIAAPVLISVLCGLGDVALSIFAQMQTTAAAQALADLGTQSAALQSSSMNDIYNAAYMMMRPLPSTNLVLRISNIVANGNNGAFVYWSCGHGALPPLSASSSYTATPTNATPVGNILVLNGGNSNGYTLSPANTSFVSVEAQYTFPSPTKFVFKKDQVTLTEAVAMPRLSSYVGFPWNGVVGQWPGLPTLAKTNGSLTFTANGNTVTCNYVN